MADIICEEDPKQNLGVSRCNILPQMFAGMITTPLNFSIPAATAAVPATCLAYLQAAVKSGLGVRIYKWPDLSGFEDNSEDAVYEETPLDDILVRDGKYRWRLYIAKSLCLHKAMFTHRGGNQRVLFYDIEGNIFGTELSDGTIAGFTVSLLNVEKLKISDGSVATKSPVYVVLKNSKEVDEAGVLFSGSFYGELVPLTDAELTINPDFATTLTTFHLLVKNACDGDPISGLVLADFAVTTTAGAAQVPTGVTESPAGSGNYVIVKSTNFADGFVNLVAASALTVDAYESTGAVAVDVP